MKTKSAKKLKKPRNACANCNSGIIQVAKVYGYDFTVLAGLPCTIRDMRVYRCNSSCSEEVLDSAEAESALQGLTSLVLCLETRLSSGEARFLRKRLGYTSKELAERMYVAEESVMDWENGTDHIVPHCDFVLRGLVFADLEHLYSPASFGCEVVLDRVRHKLPVEHQQRFVLPTWYSWGED